MRAFFLGSDVAIIVKSLHMSSSMYTPAQYQLEQLLVATSRDSHWKSRSPRNNNRHALYMAAIYSENAVSNYARIRRINFLTIPDPSIRWLNPGLLIFSFIDSLIHIFVALFLYLFVHSFIHSLLHRLSHWFIHSFVDLLIRSLIHCKKTTQNG